MKFSYFSFFLFFFILVLSTSFVTAITWNRPTTIVANLNVNNTQFWRGIATPAGIGHNSLANLTWSVAGHTMDTTLDMNSKGITEIIRLQAPDGSTIGFGDDTLFSSFSGLDQAIITATNQTLPQGAITHALLDINNEKVISAWQSGKNGSGHYNRNSMGIFPDYGIKNVSILTNIPEMWMRSGINNLLTYDSASNATALGVLFGVETQKLIILDDLSNGQILGGGDFRWISSGGDIDLYEGPVHISDIKIKQFGFNSGENLTLIEEDFETGSLGIFTLITIGKGADEWAESTSALCPTDGIFCAEAGPTGGSGETIMQTNFSTNNIADLAVTFNLVASDMGLGGDFSVTLDNNIGSGEVIIYETQTTVADTTITNNTITSIFENQSIVSLEFHFLSTHPNRGFSFVDLISVTGTTSASTLANQTVEDGSIVFGDETCKIEQFVQDGFQEMNITCDKINLLGNVSQTSVVQQTINVTTGIILGGEEITNWDNVSIFDDNVLLTNGSRPLVGNWDVGNFNITNVNRLGIGTTSPLSNLHIVKGSGNSYPAPNSAADTFVIETRATSGSGSGMTIFADNADSANIFFGDEQSATVGGISYNNSGTQGFIFTTGAVQRGVWDANGNVGIGTTSPTHKLNVVGSANITNDLYIGDDLFVTDRVGIGTDSPDTNLVVASGGGEGISLQQADGDEGIRLEWDSTYANRASLFIKDTGGNIHHKLTSIAGASVGASYLAAGPDSGNVGIGTTSPTYKLEVAGNVNLNNTLYVNESSGMVGIGTESPATTLDVSGGITITGVGNSLFFHDGSAKIYRGASNNLVSRGYGGIDFEVYPVDAYVTAMAIASSGNVGIGTPSPQNALEVVGTINATAIQIGTESVCTASNGLCGGASSGGGWMNTTSTTQTVYNVNVTTGNITVPNGRVGIGTTAPNEKFHVFVGNANTGMEFESSDPSILLKFTDNSGSAYIGSITRGLRFFVDETNIEAMRILLNGNVGIGTTSPTHKLNVVGSANITGDLLVGGTATLNDVEIVGDNITVNNINSKDGNLSFYDNGGNLEMIIDGITGNVGIGTSNPVTPLEIPGSTSGSSAKFGAFEIQSYAVNNAWIADNLYFDGSTWKYRANGYGVISYFSAGDFRIDTAISASAGDGASISNKFIVKNTGNVGIGTTSPTHKLNVVGSANITNDLYIGDDLFVTDRVGIGTSSPSSILEVLESNARITIDAVAGNPQLLFKTTKGAGRAWNFASDGNSFIVKNEDDGDGSFQIRNNTGDPIIELSLNGDSFFNGGNVGIGTTSPGAKLHVSGVVDDTDGIRMTLSGGQNIFAIQGQSTGVDYASFFVRDNRVMSLDQNGNVGIGTTTPTHKLNVVGTSNFTLNATFEKDVIITGTLFGGSPIKFGDSINFTNGGGIYLSDGTYIYNSSDVGGGGNESWTEAEADSQYALIGSGGNSSWNQSIASDLYEPKSTAGTTSFSFSGNKFRIRMS